jgi:hypothetical protein
VHRFFADPASEGVGGDALGDGFRLQPFRRDGADDAVPVTRGQQVNRNASAEREAMLDGLVAVAIAQHELVASYRGRKDNAIRRRTAVGYAVRGVGSENPGGVFFTFPDRTCVIEQGTQLGHAKDRSDRKRFSQK